MSEMSKLISLHNVWILILGFLKFSKKYLNCSSVTEVFSLLAKNATTGFSVVSILLSSVEVSELDLDRIFFSCQAERKAFDYQILRGR
jgi:hypothetical protein